MRITCLHTARSNATHFTQAADALNWPALSLWHEVHEELLSQAEAAGGMDAKLQQRTAMRLDGLAQHADAVLLTCSTLGPALAGCRSGKVWRADGMLARKVAHTLAQDDRARIALLCAAPTTVEATRQLFTQQLAQSGADRRVQLRCVDGAWALFRSADAAGYTACLTEAALQAYAAGATQVVLAQVSMADVATGWQSHAAGPAPWTVADTALRALRDMAQ